MQQPNRLLAILSNMAQKPEVQFEKLFQKLYYLELWFMAYQQIAPKPGNMTVGVDGKTIDGMSLKRIRDLIEDLKASRYKPHPVHRTYIPKANGAKRPLGIPCFQDKLLMTVIKFLLEAIYEPTFSDLSHGFRPQRSCHTALEQVQTKMVGTRWWVEGDIKGFFDHVNHETVLKILGKRITDRRFLHLIGQLLQAGYVEDWKYHQTYSGVPQGGNLSPILSNIYLNELDQAITERIAMFNRGKERNRSREYKHIKDRVYKAKRTARRTGDWNRYKTLRREMLKTPSVDHFDPGYRRLFYVRYADDFLVGVIGSKAEAAELKAWLETYLRDELQLELSAEKTLITHATGRVRFLGYDVTRWMGKRIYRFQAKSGPVTRRTGNYQLLLLMPRDKTIAFAKKYGDTVNWRGTHRNELVPLSELEILMTFNAEVRGFLGYYILANNFTHEADKVLWLTKSSFFRTVAAKRHSSLNAVTKSLKRGPGRYTVRLEEPGKPMKEYELVSSTRHFQRRTVRYQQPDQIPETVMYRSRTELGKRLLAGKCEWCETQEGTMEVHHVRKLADLQGKTLWERRMIERRRKTLILCSNCHDLLHAGKLQEKNKLRENWRAGYAETCMSGSEGG